jgi:hypothetical protein
MVVLAIEFHQFGFKVRANPPEYLAQVIQNFFGEHVFNSVPEVGELAGAVEGVVCSVVIV